MACYRVHIPAADGRPAVSAIVCGPAPRRKRCAFCGDLCDALCDFPVERVEKVAVKDLQPGDRVDTMGCVGYSRIILLEPAALGDVRVSIQRPASFGKPLLVTTVPAIATFLALRKTTCDKACCHKHRRHAGPNLDYCADHWSSWKEL